MPAANRIKIANDGLIFREDFLNPQTAAANGLIPVSNPTWLSKGVKFGINNSFKGPQISTTNNNITIICNTQIILPYTGLYRTLIHVINGKGGAYGAFQIGLRHNTNNLYLYSLYGFADIPISVSDTKIHHLVVSGNNGTASLYIDSIFIGSGSFTISGDGFNQLYIGNNNNPVTGWNQNIESVEIYNRAFSAQEISYHYRLTKGLLI